MKKGVHNGPLPAALCPHCGQLVRKFSGFDQRRPRPGDCAVCANCFGISVFGVDLRPRPPTPEEKLTFGSDPRVVAMVAGLRRSAAHREEEEEAPADRLVPS